MRVWIIVAALACAAVPPVQAQPYHVTYFVPMFDPASDASDGPAPVTAAQNGQSVEATPGSKLTIQLAVNPSTGAHWVVAEKPEFLGDADITIAAPTLAPGQRPRLGAPSTATIEFDVTGAGSGDLVVEKRGPGAQGAVQDTFRVTVTAQ